MPDRYDRYDLESLVRFMEEATGGRTWLPATAPFSTMVAEQAGTTDAAAAFDVYYAHWRSMPVDDPRRPTFAGHLLQLVPLMCQSGPCCTREQATELAAEALTVPEPRWQAVVTGTLALLEEYRRPGTFTDPVQLEQAGQDLDSVSRLLTADGDAEMAAALVVNRAAVRVEEARLRGGAAEIDLAVEELTAARRALADRPDDQVYLTCVISCLRAERAHFDRDETALARHLREQYLALARLPRNHPGRQVTESWVATTRLKLRGLTAQRPDGREGEPPPRRPTRRQPDPTDPYALALAAALSLPEAVYYDDPDSMTETCGLLRDALALCAEGDDHWVRCASLLATAHLLQAGLHPLCPKPFSHLSHGGRKVIGHIDEAVSLLRAAWRAAEGPAHPLWMSIGCELADALRGRSMMLPRIRAATAARLRKESREVALAALSGLAWSVILQSGTAHAMRAGTGAMEERCLGIARWCVADGELDEAVRALDSGRGLVLHAAQVSATVPDMLSRLGEDELAGQWLTAGPLPPEPGGLGHLDPAHLLGPAAGPGVPLRRRVLKVLAASPYRDRLLSSPAPAEIAGALRTLGADALIYLAPTGEAVMPTGLSLPASGAALMVGADGTLRSIPLPELRLDAPELMEYRTVGGAGRDARRRRDAGPVTDPQGTSAPGAGEALDRLCGWAWRAVMGPLTTQLYGNGFADARGDRVPSVVLVPLGALGVVPWHAAWRAEGQGRRYALERLRVSYAPSARTLCEVAGRRPPDAGRSGGGPALVIGDPTGDLRYAGEEAEAIHRVFYPDGVCLDADTAGAAEVSARLADLRGGVLHLACHARVDPGERHSAYLELAGGSRLAAEELTEGAGLRIEPGLVCLAACWSNVSSRGYDEAYSLATAFLAAGARTVLGSLWPVPDEATSLLMYMTHHFLRREALPPSQALRRAQLWMLDPHRRTPSDMPARLAVRARRIRPDDLTGWAGFTHQGW
ncbi:CHAT domain-containing protein [Streptomyces sp. NPDC101166]|uniref:CHAT domain-containing protein n=1 Tax=Streptomyces sp. NPDC101166 TaxID=3366120 RepID=UPI00381B0F23